MTGGGVHGGRRRGGVNTAVIWDRVCTVTKQTKYSDTRETFRRNSRQLKTN